MCTLIVGLLLCWAVAHANADDLCDVSDVDLRVRVGFVHDGDTFATDTGERVRILGIDTPELAHDRQPEEPLADEARQRLLELLPAGREIGLIFDAQRRDRYGRLLAHVYLNSTANVGELLLREGLAVQLIIPPNQRFAECFADAERHAQRSRVGVWRLPSFAPKSTAVLDNKAREFVFVRGVLTRVSSARSRTYYSIDERLTFWVGEEDIGYFSEPLLTRLRKGSTVTVRGWVYPTRHGLQMRVRHPYAVEVSE